MGISASQVQVLKYSLQVNTARPCDRLSQRRGRSTFEFWQQVNYDIV